MRHQNSVFHSIMKQVPWDVFDRLVDEHDSDARARKLSTRTQFVAMAYAQLHEAASLRHIEAGMRSQRGKLYHLGARPVRRSTLADANATRPAAVFTALFHQMVGRAGRSLRRTLDLKEAVYLIDATALPLNALSGWAEFSSNCHGAKLHVLYDATAAAPVYFSLSDARTNDITAAQAMPVTPGATYVFDLGYYDYRWWATLHANACRIVTRFKANTPLTVIETLATPPGSNILSDRIGFLPARQKHSRRNPMDEAVREIVVRTDTGRELRLLCNDLDAPAEEIAALYRQRWQVELFFRWIKQALKVRRFFGTSENAVRIQVAIALIVFLLVRAAHRLQTAIASPLAFLRAVRDTLWLPRPITHLLDPIQPIQTDHRQMLFDGLAT